MAKTSTKRTDQPPKDTPTDAPNGPARTFEELLDRLRQGQPENYYFSAEFTEALTRHMALAKRKALTPDG